MLIHFSKKIEQIFSYFHELDRPSIDLILSAMLEYWSANFKARLKEEWYLFRSQLLIICVSLLFLLYITSTIGRNLAYYRNVQLPRLQDVGYELLKELDDGYKIYSDIVMYTIHIVSIGLMLVPLLFRHYDQKFYTVNLGLRVLNILAIGHTLRAIFYLSTTLPASADHCQQNSTTYDPPTTVAQIFFRFPAGVNSNCGDQLFSGHIFQDVVFSMFVLKYSAQILGNKVISIILTIFMFGLTAVQPFLIIASRNHYSVDVVVGIYVGFTLWYIYNKLIPTDKEVPDEYKQQYIKERFQILPM